MFVTSQSRPKKWFVLAIFVLVIVGSIWGSHKTWVLHREKDRAALREAKRWAISRVDLSTFGSTDMRAKAASEFLVESSTVGPCRWFGSPLWHGSPVNPNWWSSTKSADGFRLICEADVSHGKEEDTMNFTYDWSSDWGVTSFSWQYTADYLDSGEENN